MKWICACGNVNPEVRLNCALASCLKCGSRRGPRPPFVVIEGADRVGKNTQADLLVASLRSAGVEALRHATPDYETGTGRLISELLLGRASLEAQHDDSLVSSASNAVVLQSLMVVNRYVVASKIQDSMSRGIACVCVRWWMSSLLYGAEDGQSIDDCAACYFLPEPDLFVLLDAPLGSADARLDPHNRYEASPQMQDRLAAAYRRLWSRRGNASHWDDASRWVVVPAGGGPNEVARGVWEAVSRALPALGGDE
jgi:thymidylate kinase